MILNGGGAYLLSTHSDMSAELWDANRLYHVVSSYVPIDGKDGWDGRCCFFFTRLLLQGSQAPKLGLASKNGHMWDYAPQNSVKFRNE